MKKADWKLTSFPIDHRNTLGYSFQAALNKKAATVTTQTAPARESMTLELEKRAKQIWKMTLRNSPHQYVNRIYRTTEVYGEESRKAGLHLLTNTKM